MLHGRATAITTVANGPANDGFKASAITSASRARKIRAPANTRFGVVESSGRRRAGLTQPAFAGAER
jgi:hypothetical protein